MDVVSIMHNADAVTVVLLNTDTILTKIAKKR